MTDHRARRASDRPSEMAARPDAGGRQGVIDIGSNSVRLVVFEGMGRAPVPIFNEKVLCGIGGRLSSTGRLDPDGVALALDSLPRFATVAGALGVERLHVVATAAVREAADGAAFADAVGRACAAPVRVIGGEEEARLAGLGVLAGWPAARGIAGDLGGGSLELVALGSDGSGAQATLPVGLLRLRETLAGRDDPEPVVAGHVGGLGWLKEGRGKPFYLVGGAWRALARIHMAQTGYPLHVIDHYAVATPDALDFTRALARRQPSALGEVPGVPAKRLETLPLAARLLGLLIDRIEPATVVFSAQGLREGVLYDALAPDLRAEDPVLAAGALLARRFGRFPGLGDHLWRWTEPLFDGAAPARGSAGAALRRAACLLSDVGWLDHPDYRARHACQRVLTLPIMGLDHPGRAFLALVLRARYGGAADPDLDALAARVGLRRQDAARAHVLGLALALAYTLSAGQEAVLAATALERSEKRLVLAVPADDGAYRGEAIERCLAELADALGLKPALSVSSRRKKSGRSKDRPPTEKTRIRV